MVSDDSKEIAAAWLEIQRLWWAFDRLVAMLDGAPEAALAVLEALVEQAESDDLLGAVGAGPLEDFVGACLERLGCTQLGKRKAADGEDISR